MELALHRSKTDEALQLAIEKDVKRDPWFGNHGRLRSDRLSVDAHPPLIPLANGTRLKQCRRSAPADQTIFSAVNIFRFENGKVAEIWNHRDDLGLMQQLGAPVGRDALVRGGWAGLYPGTPDRHPIIDQLAEGLFAALGFSGTGVMHAPAAGLLSAELIADGPMRSVDSRLLSASRFVGVNLSAEPTGF